MKFSFWLAVLLAIIIGIVAQIAQIQNRLALDELQWATTDGEVKAIGNHTYQETAY